MQPPVSFDANLKSDPPPHPGDDQSSKRAKLDEPQPHDDIMEADLPSETPSPIDHASATLTTECVPETQMNLETFPESPQTYQDLPMSDNTANAGQKEAPSFKDKLLNSVSKTADEDEDEISIAQGDVSIGTNGQLKLIDLDEECFLVRFKDDMDYQNALLNGPWMIFGHYLTVQPWTPSFKPHEHVINQVVGWIRLPRLPTRYYHKSVIRSIGSVFGEVVKVDYNTDSGDRGKFARIAVVIDLTKPLTSKIQVDGDLIYVEYEGLPSICFHCGRYGHLQEACPAKMAVVNTDSSENHQPKEVCASTKAKQARETALFGDWMQVQRRRRTTGAGGRKNDANGSTAVITSSRYEVLNGTEPQEDVSKTTNEVGRENAYLTGDSFPQRRKGKEVKGVKKNDPVYKQKIPDPQTKKQISSPKPPVYAEKTSATTLDKDRNSAVIITDPRLPQNSQPYPNNIGLPPLKAHHAMDNDPHSKSRGIKLASGLTIHNVGVKPNFDDAGPSVNHMKELAKDIQSALGGADSEMMVEGATSNPSLPI
ncbi:hypothetical protein K1719_013396 [Acacia pycnantha]|nr:hypothetical protein K1719_013396 [Acacia pycnantha]